MPKDGRKRPTLSPRDELIVGEMGEVFANIIESITMWAISTTAKPEDDIISQHQAEVIFGKAWLRQHTQHYGDRLFAQAVGPKNCRKRYSLKALREIKMREDTSPKAMSDFLIGVYRKMDKEMDDFSPKKDEKK